MANFEKALATIMFDILTGKTGHIGKATFKPEKPQFDWDKTDAKPLPRSTPEAEGVPTSFLYNILFELGSAKSELHHFLVLRHGKGICESSFSPYRRGEWHTTYSMSKTFTGMAIGLLYDDGKLKLNDKIVDIFGDLTNLWQMVKLRDMTATNLLTMTTGVNFNEGGSMVGDEWIKGFLSASLKENAGKVFDYNSMNTYMLSAIVSKLAGKPMYEFLQERIFNKLGINQCFWETSPEGVTKGGWGMFIRPEDAAKLGLLYLNKGKWEGEQLISEEYVNMATSKQIENEHFGYGYQLWMGCRAESYLFDGMMGQDVRVYPDLDMIIVNFAGDPVVFHSGEADAIIEKYMENPEISDKALPPNPMGNVNLSKLISELESGAFKTKPVMAGGWERKGNLRAQISSRNKPHPLKHDFFVWLNGRNYELEDKCQGVFPLLLQLTHNNFTEGMREIGFSYENHTLFVMLKEGDEVHKIKVGFHKPAYSTINLNGEPYNVALKGEYTENEEHENVLKLKLSFTEEAASRIMKIHFKDNELLLELDETPGNEFISIGLKLSMSQIMNSHFIVKRALGSGADTIINDAVMRKISPSTKGRLIENAEDNQ